MSYKNITVDVDVEIDLGEWNNHELIAEMKNRGYVCVKKTELSIDREDLQFLIEMLDKNTETWYTRRVRDKLMAARYE